MTDLKEFKKLVSYARKNGAKRLRMGELEIEFVEHATQFKPPVSAGPSQADTQTRPTPDPAPTLQDINDYIYGPADEAH